jgi:hypothetical protein
VSFVTDELYHSGEASMSLLFIDILGDGEKVRGTCKSIPGF